MVDDGEPTSPILAETLEGEGNAQPAVLEPTCDGTGRPLIAALRGTVALPVPGYEVGRSIGRGGMGEVFAAHDQRIGREVALKRMRDTTPDAEALARFLREARIQARLDHPAIVPVHELGIDECGRPYFTMKRLTGVTLARLLADGAPLPRMLRAFVEVCRAMELAHARGVVHRDLKPSNIMLGDYGEVYVLDWGVARMLSEQPDISTEPGTAGSHQVGSEDFTQSGALLGTPGYMSPEQIQNAPAAPAADVYALGCILFEILAAEALHQRGDHAIGRTLSAPQDSPARRYPDRTFAPELDGACFEALAEDPTARPTAHQLAERVQAYLDGDRDVERRRELAAREVASAREVLARAEPETRVVALRLAARAVALDPESIEATQLVSSLLLETPPQIPAELASSLETHERRINRDRGRKATYAYLSVFALLPLVLVLEIINWPVIVAFYSIVTLGAVTSWRHARTGDPSVPVVCAVNLALAIVFTRIAGPFVLTPLFITAALVAMTTIPWLNARRWAVVGWTAVAVLAPIVLERAGVLQKTWEISDDRLLVVSDLVRTHGWIDEVALTVASLLFSLVIALLALMLSRRRQTAQRALYFHAWHLNQLIPSSQRPQTQPR
ncbi:MAG: Serine/threonine protein kinase PrkC, regulator of stationary phase [Deltaproteobacteria bacterium]|nr:Serine/threonine protein kinase PrkC, regulator of stationary phase [Deltaproteobacteria bacterium]